MADSIIDVSIYTIGRGSDQDMECRWDVTLPVSNSSIMLDNPIRRYKHTTLCGVPPG